MERAEQPSREQLTSFDTLASIDLFRFDLERHGLVLPETRQRVYDEELSSMSEGVDRAVYTSFDLQRRDGVLVYFNKGKWEPYGAMLQTGLEAAASDCRNDYRKGFLLEWAERDRDMGVRMNMLRPGQQLIWHSAYPKHIEALYGADFLKKQCGLFPERQMGFIYRASCGPDGTVRLEAHSVDRSDDDAFATVQRASAYDPDVDMDTLLRTYDGTLAKKLGGRLYAGRRNSERGENAWAEIIRHGDLVTYFLDGLEQLAALDLPRVELRRRAEAHTYGVWKAFKNRLDGSFSPAAVPSSHLPIGTQLLQEVQAAYRQARANGEIKAGCGGSISFGEGPETTDPRATFDSIFGGKSGDRETSYKFDKRMYCVVCQAPPAETELKKMCGPCGICKGCDTKIRTRSKGAYALAA